MTRASLHVNLPNLDEVVFIDSRYLLPANGQIDTLYIVKSDETNGSLPTQYYFNGSEYVMISGGSGSGGMQDYQQTTKLGVTASPTVPRTYDIQIDYTANFLRAPLEILKFTTGTQNVVTTEIAFDNSDAMDFDESEYVVFDGKMKLKTDYSYPMTIDTKWTEDGTLLTKKVDLESFKTVDLIKIS